MTKDDEFIYLKMKKRVGLYEYMVYYTNKTDFDLPCETTPRRIIIIGCKSTANNKVDNKSVIYLDNVQNPNTFVEDIDALIIAHSMRNKNTKPEDIN